jgi:asparagine synthase (glutamine-hydrolysing)
MCGICGIVYKDKDRIVDRALVVKMTDTLAHRGPDDSGYYLNGNVAFGHRRLSIIDLSLGHQPISNEDETLWVTYNGEIYNHRDLRRKLEQQGHHYQTNSDTETIIHCYEEHAAAGLHQLRGMFAFALHDQKTGKLFIARDRLGIKPLYYIDTPAFFAFASEIKALLVLEEIRREVDYHALLQILALKYTTDDSTMFSGIRKLEPGHYLELQRGIVSIARYWDFHMLQADRALTENDAVERFRELLDESVRLHLLADVPLGVFLSGGIDSTVIAAHMAKMVDRPIATFSVAFKEREANELYYARMAGKHTGADQHEITMTTEDFFATLPRMIYYEDEPIAHPSSVALHQVSRLAGEHVKVVLTGEGSDELLGGYERYYQTLYNLKADKALFAILPRSLRTRVLKPLIDMLPYKFPYRNKALRTTLCLDHNIESVFLDNYSTFSRARLNELLAGDVWRTANVGGVYSGFLEQFNRSQSETLLGKLLYADVKTYLVELLMKQDQMSMAASIESRVPFLDHKLVEFAFTLPASLKIKRFNTKRILRLACGRDIPGEILNRPKAGFPVPIRRWFAGDYHQMARKIVLDKKSFCGNAFDRAYIDKLFALHRERKCNYSDQIWTLLNIELWHKIFIEREEIESIRLQPL